MLGAAFAALLCGAFPQSLSAQDAPSSAPPLAVPQTIQVAPGRPSEITLRAGGRAPGKIRFLIRKPPTRGELGEIVPGDGPTATVRYTPNPGQSGGTDEFSFAVQAFDSAVSAPGRIRIEFVEDPPLLVVPSSLDFGQVVLGAKAIRTIPLRNEGGGVFRGNVSAPAGWEVTPTAVTVPAGGNVDLALRFAPTVARTYAGVVRFDTAPATSLEVTGLGVEPFSVAEAKGVELSGDTVRTGALRLENTCGEDITVTIAVPDGVVAPESVLLPADGTKVVPLHTQTDFLGSLDGWVTLRSATFEKKIPLTVFAMPPTLSANPSSGIDFGAISRGDRVEAKWTVANHGGEDARLRVEHSTDILILPHPGGIVVSPGSSREFTVILETLKTGAFAQNIRLTADGKDWIEVPVRADVQPKNAPPKTASDGRTPTTAPSPPAPAVIPLPATKNLSIVQNIRVLERTPRSITLAWDPPAEPLARYVFEERIIGQDTKGKPTTAWRAWRGPVEVSTTKDAVVARMDRFPPNSVWFARIIPVAPTGKRLEPTPVLQLATPPQKSPWILVLILVLALTAAATWGIRTLLRHRRASLATLNERITKLGNP